MSFATQNGSILALETLVEPQPPEIFFHPEIFVESMTTPLPEVEISRVNPAENAPGIGSRDF